MHLDVIIVAVAEEKELGTAVLALPSEVCCGTPLPCVIVLSRCQGSQMLCRNF